MSRRIARFVILSVAILTLSASSRANTLVADLSQHLVGITTGFAGADVLLFGAVEGHGDVVWSVCFGKHIKPVCVIGLPVGEGVWHFTPPPV